MSSSAFLEMLRSGTRPVDELVIDAHCHMGPWYNFHIPRGGTADAMIALMDHVGIDMAIFAPHLAIGPDTAEGNRLAVAAALEHPDRLVPYVTVNPRRSLQETEAEIARYHDLLGGIRGFKFHASLHCADCSHHGYGPAYDYAEEHGIPILSHEWNGPERDGRSFLTRQAQSHPHINFLYAHSGRDWGQMGVTIPEAQRNPNVYLDLCTGSLPYGGLEHMVAAAGAEKCLFSTDNPFVDVRGQFGRLMAARISDDQKRLIFGGNAERIFGLQNTHDKH